MPDYFGCWIIKPLKFDFWFFVLNKILILIYFCIFFKIYFNIGLQEMKFLNFMKEHFFKKIIKKQMNNHNNGIHFIFLVEIFIFFKNDF